MTTNPSKPELTERQLETFNFVDAYLKANRRSPTVREVADGLGLSSPNPAYRLLVILHDKGYITWETKKGRSMKVLQRPAKPKKLKAA